MQFITEDEPDLTFPEDSIARARLEEIKLHTFGWTDKDTKQEMEATKLVWWWRVLSTSAGEQYVGRKVKGECNAKLSNRGDNRFRVWAEALLNREIPVGMAVDTDDLIGLTAEIVIGIQDDRKDPLKKWNRVTDVVPVMDGGFGGSEPPF
jgi:hypothetical protein